MRCTKFNIRFRWGVTENESILSVGVSKVCTCTKHMYENLLISSSIEKYYRIMKVRCNHHITTPCCLSKHPPSHLQRCSLHTIILSINPSHIFTHPFYLFIYPYIIYYIPYFHPLFHSFNFILPSAITVLIFVNHDAMQERESNKRIS